MRHDIFALLFVFPLLLMTSGGNAGAAGIVEHTSAFSLTDDRGRSIRLDYSARRIISLSPNITELVFAAGAGGRLVGVSRHSDYPEDAKSIPGIGDSSTLDLERIIALEPDLVIAWGSGNTVSDIEKLEKLGLTVFVTEATRLEDVSRLVRMIGTVAGTSAHAEPAASAYDSDLRRIRRSYGGGQQIRVFQLIWHRPLMTVNGNHIISDIISICGGANVFASTSSLTPVVSEESLLKADPQVIISSISPEFSRIGVRRLLRRLPHLSALASKHLFFVHPDLIQRQTPRILQAAESICAQLDGIRSSQGKKVKGV